MRVVIGERLRGKREFKLGKVYFIAMVVIMLAVLITVAASGMEASRVEAYSIRSLVNSEISDKVVDPFLGKGVKYGEDRSGSRNDELINPALSINYPLSIQNQSAIGQKWVRQESGTNLELRGITWNGNQFVAVGHTGGWGIILTSPDGIKWSRQSSGIHQYSSFDDVTWSGNKFVTAGSNMAWMSRRGVYTSPDGVSWTNQDAGTSSSLRSVSWNGSKFVAVGSQSIVSTSTDGINWTAQKTSTSLFPPFLSAVTWGGNQFVVVGVRWHYPYLA